MNLFELTRALIDIESVTENEERVGIFLLDYLSKLAERTGGRTERMEVGENRFNVLAWWGKPSVTLSTHMDTVPPFFPSREDGETIWGRGACDAKGIIAAMIGAAEELLAGRTRDFALLFVVGEERNSAGAEVAAKRPRGSRYLVNGEPTESRLAIASKGALRLEVIAAGRMAHSAYPELGESAIEALLDALEAMRKVSLPEDPVLGRCTMNIGTISGGRAPNVVPDAAKAEILVRLVGNANAVREAMKKAVGTRARIEEVLCMPALQFAQIDGLPTCVVAFATDLPVFGKSWGEPLLFGPGSIHVAHTSEERIAKDELSAAAKTYAQMVRKLQQESGNRGAAKIP